MDPGMIWQVQKSAVCRQQPVSMISQVVALVIKIFPENIVELQERFGCQIRSDLLKALLVVL
jgi:hypothetical protein